jgi:hypothetical protein
VHSAVARTPSRRASIASRSSSDTAPSCGNVTECYLAETPNYYLFSIDTKSFLCHTSVSAALFAGKVNVQRESTFDYEGFHLPPAVLSLIPSVTI